MWRIVTDTTTDMPLEFVKQHGIRMVPISIQFGEETYQDRVTIDEETFYRLVEEKGIIPKTSQPAPGEFLQVYTALRDEGADAILSIHISSKLSGTYESALQASRMVKDKIRVEVFDSLSGSAGSGFMVMEAARMAAEGKSIEEAQERLAWMRDHTRIYFMLDNLKFPQMSGRITFVQHMVASMLRMKPLITVVNGELMPVERVRTRTRAFQRMVDLVAEEFGSRPVRLAIAHARSPETAQQLLTMASERLNTVTQMVLPLAISIAVHFGPGALGIVVCPVE